MGSQINQKKQNISFKYRFVGYFANANDVPGFHIPILLFYAKSDLGLSFTQTILIFYGLGFLTSFFEIPAGSFGDIFLSRSVSTFYVVRIISMSLGGYLYTIDSKLPLTLTVIILILCGLFTLLISDKNITPEHHNARSLFGKTFKEIIASRELKSICIIVFIGGIFGNFIWRLFQPVYGLLNIEVQYIGYFYALFSLGGVFGALTLGRITGRRKLFEMLLFQFTIGIITFIVTAYYLNIFTLTIALLLASIFFPLSEAALVSYMQHKFERYQQATILSILSFLFWAGLYVADALAGLSIYLFGVKDSLTVNAILGIFSFLIVAPIVLKNIKIEDNEISS